MRIRAAASPQGPTFTPHCPLVPPQEERFVCYSNTQQTGKRTCPSQTLLSQHGAILVSDPLVNQFIKQNNLIVEQVSTPCQPGCKGQERRQHVYPTKLRKEAAEEPSQRGRTPGQSPGMLGTQAGDTTCSGSPKACEEMTRALTALNRQGKRSWLSGSATPTAAQHKQVQRQRGHQASSGCTQGPGSIKDQANWATPRD